MITPPPRSRFRLPPSAIAPVDYIGGLAEGRLVRGHNPVLMTMELVLDRSESAGIGVGCPRPTRWNVTCAAFARDGGACGDNSGDDDACDDGDASPFLTRRFPWLPWLVWSLQLPWLV